MPKPKDVERCKYMYMHEIAVNQVDQNIPDKGVLYDPAELSEIFSDSTHIKILCVLFEPEMCICGVTQLLGIAQSTISHQLRPLEQNRLTKARREDKIVFYSLTDGHVHTVPDQEMEHAAEPPSLYVLQRNGNFTMKEHFKLIDLDCADCAAKMEAAIKKLDSARDATVNFMTQKLALDADDARFDGILNEIVKACKRVEPDCTIIH